MRGKKRPPIERHRAVALALVEGVPAAAEATGIPQSTIYEWRERPEFEELRKRTREQVAEEWWGIIQLGFRRVAQLLTDTDDLQKAAVATAIVTDKMLLIRGEATSRYESRALVDGLSDHERELLGAAIRGELARRAEPPAAEVAVGPAGEAGTTRTEG